VEDVHRTAQDMAAGTFVYDLIENIAQVLLYLMGRQAGSLEARLAIGNQISNWTVLAE
jgi:hypothetical protein